MSNWNFWGAVAFHGGILAIVVSLTSLYGSGQNVGLAVASLFCILSAGFYAASVQPTCTVHSALEHDDRRSGL